MIESVTVLLSRKLSDKIKRVLTVSIFNSISQSFFKRNADFFLEMLGTKMFL